MKTSLSFLAVTVLFAANVLAEAPKPETEFRKTLSAAAKEQKLAFILLGRPSCGNCNATKAMIKDAKIAVTSADYVMGDLNIDDAKTQAEFMRKYGREDFGNTLPFVVVTDSQGKLLASSGGFKDATKWNAILAEAKGKAAGKAPAAGAGGKDPNWPFSTAKPQQ